MKTAERHEVETWAHAIGWEPLGQGEWSRNRDGRGEYAHESDLPRLILDELTARLGPLIQPPAAEAATEP